MGDRIGRRVRPILALSTEGQAQDESRTHGRGAANTRSLVLAVRDEQRVGRSDSYGGVAPRRRPRSQKSFAVRRSASSGNRLASHRSWARPRCWFRGVRSDSGAPCCLGQSGVMRSLATATPSRKGRGGNANKRARSRRALRRRQNRAHVPAEITADAIVRVQVQAAAGELSRRRNS